MTKQSKVNIYLDGKDAYITRNAIRDEDFRLHKKVNSLNDAISNVQALKEHYCIWIDKEFNRPETDTIGIFEVIDGYVRELGDDVQERLAYIWENLN